MIDNEKGSLMISFSFIIPVIMTTILTSILFRANLKSYFDQKQFCRKNIIKHHWILAKGSQKLIDSNKEVYKIRIKITKELGKLALNPSPAHKAKILYKLNKLRVRLQKIGIEQKLLELKTLAKANLNKSRFISKAKRMFCEGNSILKKKCHFFIAPRFSELLVKSDPLQIGGAKIYSWNPNKARSKQLRWENFVNFSDHFFKGILEPLRQKITCRAQLKHKPGENSWIIHLNLDRA